FEGDLAVVALAWQQEMMVGIRQLYDLVLVFLEEGMVEEDIFGEQCLAGARFFGRLVQQDIVVDNDADVAGKDKVRDRGEQEPVVIRSPADKGFGELDRVELLQVLLDLVGTGFDS